MPLTNFSDTTNADTINTDTNNIQTHNIQTNNIQTNTQNKKIELYTKVNTINSSFTNTPFTTSHRTTHSITILTQTSYKIYDCTKLTPIFTSPLLLNVKHFCTHNDLIIIYTDKLLIFYRSELIFSQEGIEIDGFVSMGDFLLIYNSTHILIYTFTNNILELIKTVTEFKNIKAVVHPRTYVNKVIVVDGDVVVVYNLRGKVLYRIGMQGVRFVVESPLLDVLAFVGDDSVRIYDVKCDHLLIRIDTAFDAALIGSSVGSNGSNIQGSKNISGSNQGSTDSNQDSKNILDSKNNDPVNNSHNDPSINSHNNKNNNDQSNKSHNDISINSYNNKNNNDKSNKIKSLSFHSTKPLLLITLQNEFLLYHLEEQRIIKKFNQKIIHASFLLYEDTIAISTPNSLKLTVLNGLNLSLLKERKKMSKISAFETFKNGLIAINDEEVHFLDLEREERNFKFKLKGYINGRKVVVWEDVVLVLSDSCIFRLDFEKKRGDLLMKSQKGVFRDVSVSECGRYGVVCTFDGEVVVVEVEKGIVHCKMDVDTCQSAFLFDTGFNSFSNDNNGSLRNDNNGILRNDNSGIICVGVFCGNELGLYRDGVKVGSIDLLPFYRTFEAENIVLHMNNQIEENIGIQANNKSIVDEGNSLYKNNKPIGEENNKLLEQNDNRKIEGVEKKENFLVVKTKEGICLIDTKTQKITREFTAQNITEYTISPDFNFIAVKDNQRIFIYDIIRSKLIHSFESEMKNIRFISNYLIGIFNDTVEMWFNNSVFDSTLLLKTRDYANTNYIDNMNVTNKNNVHENDANMINNVNDSGNNMINANALMEHLKIDFLGAQKELNKFLVEGAGKKDVDEIFEIFIEKFEGLEEEFDTVQGYIEFERKNDIMI